MINPLSLSTYPTTANKWAQVSGGTVHLYLTLLLLLPLAKSTKSTFPSRVTAVRGSSVFPPPSLFRTLQFLLFFFLLYRYDIQPRGLPFNRYFMRGSPLFFLSTRLDYHQVPTERVELWGDIEQRGPSPRWSTTVGPCFRKKVGLCAVVNGEKHSIFGSCLSHASHLRCFSSIFRLENPFCH